MHAIAILASGLVALAAPAVAAAQGKAGEGKAGEAQAAEVCVVNASEAAHFFVAEAKDGMRASGKLAPGGRLCAQGGGTGTVWAYDDPDAVEGCSRLVEGGMAETLLRFADFDRCLWASQNAGSGG